jgi:putative endonuclease
VGVSRRGRRAEQRAVLSYRLRGYRILGRNVWAGGHELDLVARRGRRLVFCEVKEKTGPRFGDPFEMVHAEKRRRLRRAGEAWLQAHPDHGGLDVRFDVVGVWEGRLRRVVGAF